MSKSSKADPSTNISLAAAKRLLKAAGARRSSEAIVKLTRTVFRRNLDEIFEKVYALIKGERNVRTLLPRHVDSVAEIIGSDERGAALFDMPRVALAPIKRRLRQMSKGNLVIGRRGLERLIAVALDHTIRALRSAAGLAAHENDRKTVQVRDLQNAEVVCRDWPK